ncbi:hypothetical protein [Paenibacillus humicola]|uniref:hypothetical protein n=1 Tax=Paenibacillus humicola TaxID=3110540 RepID=UPI00237B05EE|nr:hypothetical protein [Paenibacillus humicola]
MTTPFTFGIYPLSPAGSPTGLALGPEDDYGKIRAALQELRGNKTLHPRMYVVDMGTEMEARTLAAAERYAANGLLGNWAIGNLHPSELDMDGWLRFVRTIVGRYGSRLASLQITNEPNLSFMEGSKPNIALALVEGVKTAKQEALKLGLRLPVGFGSVPDGPAAVPGFWESLARTGGKPFAEAVDFVGHNFYPDVFEAALEPSEIPASVERTLRELREKHLAAAGLPASVPIRVAENGWPTGINPFDNRVRTCERQAEVLETVIRTVHGLREELNITHYVLFDLRDADSSKEDPFHQFGIMRDDYTPKPAYFTFKQLIKELGD